MEIKLLRLISLPNETSNTIADFCKESLQKADINFKKCIAFCGDNANTNFGGRLRRGKNNVFAKLKISMNENLEGIGCPAHVLHNTMQTAADVLSIDVEAIVVKFLGISVFTQFVPKILSNFVILLNIKHYFLIQTYGGSH